MKEFWENVFRYPRYFITITLGIFFFLFERLRPLLSRPVTAIAAAIDGIMSAHLLIPAWDDQCPTTLSPLARESIAARVFWI